MQKQFIEEDKKEPAVEFEQCPVCESYEVAETNREYCCNRCGVSWIAVRRWD